MHGAVDIGLFCVARIAHAPYRQVFSITGGPFELMGSRRGEVGAGQRKVKVFPYLDPGTAQHDARSIMLLSLRLAAVMRLKSPVLDRRHKRSTCSATILGKL